MQSEEAGSVGDDDALCHELTTFLASGLTMSHAGRMGNRSSVCAALADSTADIDTASPVPTLRHEQRRQAPGRS